MRTRDPVSSKGVGRTVGLGPAFALGLGFLFAFAANAFGLQYLFLGAAAFLMVLQGRNDILHVPVDINLIMLVLFAGTYSLATYSSVGGFVMPLVLPGAYLLGFIAVRAGHHPPASNDAPAQAGGDGISGLRWALAGRST